MSHEMESPIEAYLDDLYASSRALPIREARHLLAETEAHLRDATDALCAQGMPAPDAERRAVERFGPVEALVSADRTRGRLTLPALAARVAVSGVRLGSIGAVLVGLSGVVAALIRLVGGPRSLVDVAPGTTLSPADCTRWVNSGASAAACRAAAISDWTAETIYYRIALGVIGALVLFALRATARGRRRLRELDQATTDTIAVTLLIVGGVWTLGLGVDASVVGGGSGQWFSAAVVAITAAAWYGVRVTQRLRGTAGPSDHASRTLTSAKPASTASSE